MAFIKISNCLLQADRKSKHPGTLPQFPRRLKGYFNTGLDARAASSDQRITVIYFIRHNSWVK